MRAPNILRGNRKERLLALALFMAFTVMLSGCVIARENGQARAKAQRLALAARLMPHMQSCARIGRKMGYAGADIRGELMSELKILLPTVTELNSAIREICGAEYMPIDEVYLRKISDNISLLESSYRRSENTASLEEALRQKLCCMDDLLALRFTAEGDIVLLRKNT